LVVRQRLLSILLPVSSWLAWRNFLGIHSLLGVKVVVLTAEMERPSPKSALQR
jgi:hypothetical protein